MGRLHGTVVEPPVAHEIVDAHPRASEHWVAAAALRVPLALHSRGAYPWRPDRLPDVVRWNHES